MNIEPITKNPEYAAAAAKLAEYRAALARAKDEAARLSIEAASIQNRRPESNADVLKEADALLAGDDPARADVAARQAKNERLMAQLRKAADIQNAEVLRLTDELSNDARKAAHAEYAPLVQNVMNALDALVAANAAVREYLLAFDAAGYRGLTTYWFMPPSWDRFDPHDRFDTFTSNWWDVAQKYVEHGLLPHERPPMPTAAPAAKPTAAQRVAAVAKALGHRTNNPNVGELVR